MLEGTQLELSRIPVRYEGSAHELQSYTILIPGRETTFSVPVGASEQDIADRAASALAQYRTDPAVPLQLLWHYTAIPHLYFLQKLLGRLALALLS